MVLIHRTAIRSIRELLLDHTVVLVEGPPRCGKSTLARQLAASSPSGSVLVDARLREGRAILAAPGSQSAARPIILDNAGQEDAGSLMAWAHTAGQNGNAKGSNFRLPRFVLVGGPFGKAEPYGDRPRPDDISGHRVARVRMGPLSLFEAGRASMKRLWLRGGYPEAFGATSDEAAADCLETYVADLAHDTLAAWGLPREPDLITDLLEAVAADNGSAFNENAAARSLGVSRPTISRYVDILERAGILFSLPALSPVPLPGPLEEQHRPAGSVPNREKPGANRAIKSAALYIKDTGLLHALLGVRSADDLALKPRQAAASWTGFVVGQAREALSPGAALYRFASADGAVLDLVVVREGLPVLVAVARRHRPGSVERSISYAASTLLGRRCPETGTGSVPGRFIVVPEGEERLLPGGFVMLNLGAFLAKLVAATE